jgi:hypothetical protein
MFGVDVKNYKLAKERRSEIISFEVFGHLTNPTVFFVYDFDRFYRFKMKRVLSIVRA